MSDRDLRELERRAAQGETEAEAELARKRVALGLCPWCGVRPAGLHVLLSEPGEPGELVEDVTRTCCCDMTCGLGLKGAAFRGPDWSRCDGLGTLHCVGCPAVDCKVTPAQADEHARAFGACGSMDLEGVEVSVHADTTEDGEEPTDPEAVGEMLRGVGQVLDELSPDDLEHLRRGEHERVELIPPLLRLMGGDDEASGE